MKEKFFEELASKMIKAIHNKNGAIFAGLKASFTSAVQKHQDKELLAELDKYSGMQKFASVNNNTLKNEIDLHKFEINNTENHLKNALRVDKWARAIEVRWNNLTAKQKAQFLSLKHDDADLGYKYSGAKFANYLEEKRLNLQAQGINMSKDAFYELMKLGYKPEEIVGKNGNYILSVAGKRSKVTFASKTEFEKYLQKHEANFNDSLNHLFN